MLKTLISALPVTELLLEARLNNGAAVHLPLIYLEPAFACLISVCRLSGGKWESPKLSYAGVLCEASCQKCLSSNYQNSPHTGLFKEHPTVHPKGPVFPILKTLPGDSWDPGMLLQQFGFAYQS